MKKIILLLLVAVMLTGCCISHEWTESTCTTAKTCTKCGETEEFIQGHSWQDATCTEAKTCIICGVTEGNAAGHAIGAWEETADSVIRKCSGCNLTETMPEEQQEEWKVTQFILGKWQVHSIGLSLNNYTLIDLAVLEELGVIEGIFETYRATYVTFYEDGRFEQDFGLYSEPHSEGTWSFEPSDKISGPSSWCFKLLHEDGYDTVFMSGGYITDVCFIDGVDKSEIAFAIQDGSGQVLLVHEKIS